MEPVKLHADFKSSPKPLKGADHHRAGYAVKQGYAILLCDGCDETVIDFVATEAEADKLVASMHEAQRKKDAECAVSKSKTCRPKCKSK